MRSKLDFPDPLRPNTPIFAPGKNDKEISFRICRFGGTTLLTRFIVKTYCAIINNTFLEKWIKMPQTIAKSGRISNQGQDNKAKLVLHCISQNCEQVIDYKKSNIR